jgi:hypothetical protein
MAETRKLAAILAADVVGFSRQFFGMQSVVALGHFLAGRDDEAYACAEAALRDMPTFPLAAGVAAASAACSGRGAEVANAVRCLIRIDPNLGLTNFSAWLSFQRPQDASAMTADGRAGALVGARWRTGGFWTWSK